MNSFEGDVKLISTLDGGDLEIENNLVQLTGGFETAVYLSLYGGNKKDDGTESTKNDSWWGNQLESEPARKMVSKSQALISTLPLIPSNLVKFEEATKQDLSWFISDGIADTINVTASIPSPKRLERYVEILKNGELLGDFNFIENWKAAEANG